MFRAGPTPIPIHSFADVARSVAMTRGGLRPAACIDDTTPRCHWVAHALELCEAAHLAAHYPATFERWQARVAAFGLSCDKIRRSPALA